MTLRTLLSGGRGWPRGPVARRRVLPAAVAVAVTSLFLAYQGWSQPGQPDDCDQLATRAAARLPADSNRTRMGLPRSAYHLAQLRDGRILAVGGYSGDDACAPRLVAEAELYDPTTSTWSPAGKLAVARRSPSATLLADGRVLVTGGRPLDAGRTAELYDPTTGAWSDAGRMSAGRDGHTATLLPDGRVLVVGGGELVVEQRRVGGFRPKLPVRILAERSAELYDPILRTWSAAGSMAAARAGHTALLLGDGRVLIVGGATFSERNGVPVRSAANPWATPESPLIAEVYDPRRGTWTPSGPTSSFTSIALGLTDGRTLVLGYDHAFVFDHTSSRWGIAGQEPVTSRAAMGRSSMAHMLAGGRVLALAAPGNRPDQPMVAFLYDPVPNTWAAAGSMRQSREESGAAVLADGRLLVYGGYHFPSSTRLSRGPGERREMSELFDPRTGAWTLTEAVPQGVEGEPFQLPDGRLLVLAPAMAHIFDPRSGRWSSASPH